MRTENTDVAALNGETEITHPIRILPIQQRQMWSYVGGDDNWSVDVMLQRIDDYTIHIHRLTICRDANIRRMRTCSAARHSPTTESIPGHLFFQNFPLDSR